MLTDPKPTPPAPAPTLDEAPAPSARWAIHVVADSDTRWKWGAAVANRLRADGKADVHGHLLEGRATPNDQQIADVGAKAATIRRVGIAQLLSDLANTEADIVVLSCVGGTIQSLMHGLARVWKGRTTRPIIVTGYVGLVYEKLVDGLLLRAGADVVLANSAHDAREFRDVFTAVGANPDSVVRTALPFLGGAPYDPSEIGDSRPFTLVFVAQPSVPSTREERRYVMEQVLEHALQHPDRHIIVKLRGRVGEQTTHIERHHYADLLSTEEPIPANIEIAYGSMSDVLDRTDLCVTVSSTAALEAMHRGIPTAILTDFGVRESLGNHAFLHSGAYAAWSALHAGLVPATKHEWAVDNGVQDSSPYDDLQARVAELVADRSLVPPLLPWFATADAAGYLPKLLGRNGLAADGSPLVDDVAWTKEDPGLRRRVMRAGARRAYRLAVRTVEPRVRKWAQL